MSIIAADTNPGAPLPIEATEHFDVLIVGAGLSGIGAGCHLESQCPGKSYAILEARDCSGGTWDLFRYPGIRSDSDMYTLGYSFRPWTGTRSIADGESILRYLRDTARERGVDRRIRYHHRVIEARWSSEEERWTVEAERTDTGERVRLTCGFLMMCTGYYSYEKGYTPDFEGADRFRGRMVHAQQWSPDIDYAGKRVVVIGSGATAVTLVPAMARDAAHVTMLQRSPTYVVSLPGEDPIARTLRRHLPERLAYPLVRWKNVLLTTAHYQLSRRRPALVKALIRKGLEHHLPAGYDIDRHFTPRYNPWDQRLCLVPDADLFEAIGSGRASVATDQISSFTETGLRLASGAELEADIVVMATGLDLLALGGARLVVDGREVELGETVGYRGMMLSGVPNMAFVIGYTNASWTLKSDLTCEFICRLLNFMDAHGYVRVAPADPDSSVAREPLIDFSSGYVLRAIDRFPKQGSRPPWRLRQNYVLDRVTLSRGSLEDGALIFGAPHRTGTGSSADGPSRPVATVAA